nr:hypothetical protein [Tanacetum cinerariifolium]
RNHNGLIVVQGVANQNPNGNEEQYTKLLDHIPEPHQVPQNDNNVISEVSSVEQSWGTVEQHPENVEETRVANQNPNGNGNVVAAWAEGNEAGNNGIQLQAKEFDLMDAAAYLDKI